MTKKLFRLTSQLIKNLASTVQLYHIKPQFQAHRFSSKETALLTKYLLGDVTLRYVRKAENSYFNPFAHVKVSSYYAFFDPWNKKKEKKNLFFALSALYVFF